jgi:hypothetical protein
MMILDKPEKSKWRGGIYVLYETVAAGATRGQQDGGFETTTC